MHLLVQRISKGIVWFRLGSQLFFKYYNSKSIVSKTYSFRYNINCKQWEANTGGNSVFKNNQEIKSNVIMKRINFNQRPTPVARGSSRATCENSTKRMWWLVVTVSVPSGFSDLTLLGVCCNASVPSRAFVMRSPLELIIMPLLGWQLLPSPSLAGSQTWESSTTRSRRLTFREQPLLLHSIGREQGWGHLRATPGFGVFWFIPPLLSKPIFGQPPLYGRFSLVCTQGRRDLSSSGVYRTKSWRLEGVRIWKLSRTYPDEKPFSLSVLTHGCSLVTRKPTRHLLTMPYILVRIGAPYEGRWSIQFHLPRNMAPSLNPRLF